VQHRHIRLNLLERLHALRLAWVSATKSRNEKRKRKDNNDLILRTQNLNQDTQTLNQDTQTLNQDTQTLNQSQSRYLARRSGRRSRRTGTCLVCC
jgi:hypothetical protein